MTTTEFNNEEAIIIVVAAEHVKPVVDPDTGKPVMATAKDQAVLPVTTASQVPAHLEEDTSTILTFEMVQRNATSPPQSQTMSGRNAPDVGEDEKEGGNDDESFANALEGIEALSNQVALSTAIHDVETLTDGMDRGTPEDIIRCQHVAATQIDPAEEMRRQSAQSNTAIGLDLREARRLRQKTYECPLWCRCCPLGFVLQARMC